MTKFVKIIIFSAAGVVALAFIIRLSPLNKILGPSFPLFRPAPAVSQNILYLTPAIKSFSGKVEKVGKDNIIISKEAKVEGLDNSPSKKISYKIIITPETKINRLMSSANASSIADITPGKQVTALTESDLRYLQGSEFKAGVINILPEITSLSGNIVDIKDNVLTVKGTAIIPPVPELFAQGPATEKDFKVSLAEETEISRLKAATGSASPQEEKLKIADLKKGQTVTVDAGSDISTSARFTAKKIRVGTGPAAQP